MSGSDLPERDEELRQRLDELYDKLQEHSDRSRDLRAGALMDIVDEVRELRDEPSVDYEDYREPFERFESDVERFVDGEIRYDKVDESVQQLERTLAGIETGDYERGWDIDMPKPTRRQFLTGAGLAAFAAYEWFVDLPNIIKSPINDEPGKGGIVLDDGRDADLSGLLETEDWPFISDREGKPANGGTKPTRTATPTESEGTETTTSRPTATPELRPGKDIGVPLSGSYDWTLSDDGEILEALNYLETRPEKEIAQAGHTLGEQAETNNYHGNLFLGLDDETRVMQLLSDGLLPQGENSNFAFREDNYETLRDYLEEGVY